MRKVKVDMLQIETRKLGEGSYWGDTGSKGAREVSVHRGLVGHGCQLLTGPAAPY
jgi:hypothetical protein